MLLIDFYCWSCWLTSAKDGLALVGNAPRVFTKTSKNGLPWVSVIFCSLFSSLAYMGISNGAGRVFGWLANLTAICGLITWTGICCKCLACWFGTWWIPDLYLHSDTYLRFYAGMKAQGIDRSTLPFRSPLQPYAAYYGLFSTFIICFVRNLPFCITYLLKFSTLTAVQRMVRVPKRRMGDWCLFDQLSPFDMLPVDLPWSALLFQRTNGGPSKNGLYFGHCGDPRWWVSRVCHFASLDTDHRLFRVDDPPPRNRLEKFWRWLVSYFYQCDLKFVGLMHRDLQRCKLRGKNVLL